jgi:hypothetical protein
VPATNDDIMKKLNEIEQKVTSEQPNRIQRFISKWQYPIMGLAWIIGALTHKWGFFGFITKVF